MEEIIIRSPNGKESLTLSGGVLKLRRKKNETIIPLSQIVSFEIKKSTYWSGIISIHTSKSADAFLKLNSFLTLGNNPSIEFVYSADYQEQVQKMRERIASYSAGETPTSAADEIKKYKELLDIGAITQE